MVQGKLPQDMLDPNKRKSTQQKMVPKETCPKKGPSNRNLTCFHLHMLPLGLEYHGSYSFQRDNCPKKKGDCVEPTQTRASLSPIRKFLLKTDSEGRGLSVQRVCFISELSTALKIVWISVLATLCVRARSPVT